MPRRKRTYLPGYTYHVYQRGNNRNVCIIERSNYSRYIDLWRTASKLNGVEVHSYCLMTNHVHFLVTPSSSSGLSDTMRIVGSQYAQYINHRYSRTGTLWEGRHKSSLVETEQYFLTCMRYKELNPVRAGMVNSPEEYVWSSYGANAWGDQSWLSPHKEYLALGSERTERLLNYRQLFQEKLGEPDLERIRKAAYYCQPVGNDRFRKMIEEKYGLKPGYIKRGRPGKEEVEAG